MALEIFSNNSQTTLNGAINAVQVVITVNPGTISPGWPFPTTGNFRILIDNEIMLVTAVAGLNWTVVRGVEAAEDPAAVAAPHADKALVSCVDTSAGYIQAINDRAVWSVSAGANTALINSLSMLVFSDAGNVSFGLLGSVITATAGAAAGANINLSAGTTSNLSSAFTFSNSPSVSFGLDAGTITASAAALLNISAGVEDINLTAITFANSNGVSFGLNGSTMTASVQTGINLSAGTTSNLSSAFTFGNANGVSFGLDAGTITASIASVASSLTAINVSAGTTSNNLSALTFANSNGVSFGLNGSTLTASIAAGAAVGTVTAFSQDADFVTHVPAGQAALSLQKLSLPMNLLATQLLMLAALNGSSGSSGALTISHAVYTLSGSTASLASSGSVAYSFQSGSATSASSQYGGASGTRYRSISVSYAMTPGDYLFAWWISTANSVGCSVFGRAGLNIVGTYAGAETAYFLPGTSVSSVVALPSSIVATDTGYARTGFSALLQPGAILLGTY